MKKYIGIVIFVLVLVACRNHSYKDPREEQKVMQQQKEALVSVNKYLVRKDKDKIDAFIKRRNWSMNVTKTGLYYAIYEKNNGTKAVKNCKATIKYKVSLLDGTECYSSEKNGLKNFVVGEGGVESGLEEGILLMGENDKARFIMPPHLAHGLIGDQNRIPARAIIIYEVELVSLN